MVLHILIPRPLLSSTRPNPQEMACAGNFGFTTRPGPGQSGWKAGEPRGRRDLLSLPERTCHKKAGMKVRTRWFLKTVDGRDIYQDFGGMPTFEKGANIPFEFIDGQQPHQDKEFLSREISALLMVDCVWVRVQDWIQQG
jgi:hypothetical protein